MREMEIKERKLAGEDRINFTGINSTSTPAGGSGRRSDDPNVTPLASFLRTAGDTMIGALAFYPTAVTISSGAIDISQDTTSKFSTYVIVSGEGAADDTLNTITGAAFAGQIAYIQPIITNTITFTETGGNLILPGGTNIVANSQKDGRSVLKFIFDVTVNANKWTLVSSSAGGGNEFQDSLFRIFDDIDPTRKLAFQTGGIAASTTRTVTIQDVDGTMALIDGGGTQIFSNTNEFIDNLFFLRDDIDSTRKAQFQTGGISAATTRIFTFQDVDATLAVLDGGGTQIFSNTNEFIDNLFFIRDDIDNTRKLQFQTGGIATSTTRTWTAQNADGTVCLLDSGLTQEFSTAIDMNQNNFLDVNDLNVDTIIGNAASGHTITFDSNKIIINVPTGKSIELKSNGIEVIDVTSGNALFAGSNTTFTFDITMSGGNLIQSGAGRYHEFDEGTAPSTPAATKIRLFMDSTNGKLSVKKDDASVVDLETPGGVAEGDSPITWTGIHSFNGASTSINSGTIVLGDSSVDNLSIVARINSSVIPDANTTYDLGSDSLGWRKGFFKNRLQIPVGSNLFD